MRAAHRLPRYTGAIVGEQRAHVPGRMPCAGCGLAATESASRISVAGIRPRIRPMLDFAAARRMMVDCQVRTSDVTDLRLIAAMLMVPREQFVPKAAAELAYLDTDLPVGTGARALTKPMVLAKLVQAAEIKETD